MRTIGIIGATGRLGKAVGHHYANHGAFKVLPFSRRDFDLASSESVRRTLLESPCDFLVNCAALTDVDYCETHHEEADRLNGGFLADLGWVAARTGARILHFSTDYVFDGNQSTPYTETDETHPRSYYGKSKLLGERHLFGHSDRHVVLRISWLYGAAKPAFPEWILAKAMKTGSPLPVVGDKWACPTSAEDVARLLEPFLAGKPIDGGIYHLCNRGVYSWSDYARLVLKTAASLGVDLRTREIRDVPMASIDGFVAPRPVHSSLDTLKFETHFGLQPLTTAQAMLKHLSTTIQNTHDNEN